MMMQASEWMVSPDYELLCAGITPQAEPGRGQDLRIPARDGIALAATAYEPRGAAGLAVVINGATGVPRGYYRAFADYLAGHGCAVLTYDYRGIGGSRDGGGGARMRDWGEHDLAGALAWMERYPPRLPLAAIGHSAGGWLMGLADNNRCAGAALMVGSQVPYWRHWPTLGGKLVTWATMHLLIPGATRLCGHLPGAVFGGEALPPGIALEWARWSRHRDFLVDDAGQPLREHFREYRNPVRLIAVSDDIFAPPPAVRALSTWFGGETEVQTLRPRDVGLRRLGHFGWFRKDMPRQHWDEALRWLRRHAR